jgi:hypothetical protein
MLSPRLDRFRPLLAAGFFSAALAAVPLSSNAATVQSTTSKFTGSPPSVSITIDDSVDPGNLVITLGIESADPAGDLTCRPRFAMASRCFPTWYISSRTWISCGQTLNPAPGESATLQVLRSMNSTLAIDSLLHRTGRARRWALNIKRSDSKLTSSLHEQLGG